MPNPEDIENPLWNDPRGIRWNQFYWNGPPAPPPPPLSTPSQTKKHKTMPKQPFMPRTESAKPPWLDRLVDALQNTSKGYATKYNVPAATITALDNGRQWVNAITNYLAAVRASSQSLTAFKNQLFTGGGAITPPVAPVFTAPGVPLAAGVFTLAGSVGVQIKDAVNYAEADGRDMGLEGAVIAPALASLAVPDLSKSRLTSGGHPEVVWAKLHAHTAIKLMVDRGDGHGEIFLAIDTVPNYIDTMLPARGATAIWTYRGIYMENDEEFGQWSQPFQITVRG